MGQNHSSSFTSSLMRNSMLFDHLHQFLSALVQRANAGYVSVLPNGNKAKLGIITGLGVIALRHCNLGRTNDAFCIHRSHATLCPVLQNVRACKVQNVGRWRGLDKLTSGLYCTSFPHLLQLCIGCIETFLFTGNEANLTAGTATKPCHIGAGAVGSAAGLGMELAARRGKHCMR
mgnify:CR=1 FL=1